MVSLYFISGWIFSISAFLIVICAVFRVVAAPVRMLPFVFMAAALFGASAYAAEAFFAFRSDNPYERAAFAYRLFGQYWWAYWIVFLSNCLLPNFLWIRRLRGSFAALIVIPIMSLLLANAEFVFAAPRPFGKQGLQSAHGSR